MQINISGKNMDTGMAFQEHATTSLNMVVEKYFQNAVSGHVTLEKAESGFTDNGSEQLFVLEGKQFQILGK